MFAWLSHAHNWNSENEKQTRVVFHKRLSKKFGAIPRSLFPCPVHIKSRYIFIHCSLYRWFEDFGDPFSGLAPNLARWFSQSPLAVLPHHLGQTSHGCVPFCPKTVFPAQFGTFDRVQLPGCCLSCRVDAGPQSATWLPLHFSVVLQGHLGLSKFRCLTISDSQPL